MQFSELAAERFSVLEYGHRSVGQEAIDQILVIDDDRKRQQLARVVPGRYYTPLAFLVCYDTTKCWKRPMDGKSSGEIDAAIVTTHMMLQATDLGLGTI